MPTFSSDGIEIAYIHERAAASEAGDGGPAKRPVLLIHGFASNLKTNWVDTGWVRDLTAAGHDVVAFDHRGHGRSAKLYDEAQYGAPLFAEDACRLLDHLSIERAHILGFSMGARVAAFMTIQHGQRVERAVFSGLGANMISGLPGAGAIAEGLLADSIDEITNPVVRNFRQFAEATRSDLRALAACIRSARVPISPDMLATISRPVLVAVGTDDPIGGPASELAAAIPGAKAFDIVGRDHMKSVGDKTHKAAVLAFFARG